MGVMALPVAGIVYVDTMVLIYTFEYSPPYWSMLEPLWLKAQAGAIEVVSSELALMEAMVGPLKSGNVVLAKAFENALLGTDMRLIPITQPILWDAARVRATSKLKTPDAIHAATARHVGCALFITNDAGFRGVAGLPVAILDDFLIP